MPDPRPRLLMLAGIPARAWFALAVPLLSCSALVGASAPVPPPLGGSLVVTPTRLVLEGRTRSAEIFLHNAGNAAATYRISLVELEMDEYGQTTEQPAPPGPTSAAGLLRYAPRQVLLAPGRSQTVRIQVRKPEHLAVGEYRSHILFRAVPDPPAATPGAAPEAGLGVSIQAIYGVSIPIILRHGAVQAKAALAELRLVRSPGRPGCTGRIGRHGLSFQIHRDGNRSLYGDLQATWQPKAGQPRPAGQLNGVAVYANLPRRHISLPLAELQGQALGAGRLKVAYLESGSRKVLAEALLDVQDVQEEP